MVASHHHTPVDNAHCCEIASHA
ncbi:hypothetical protein VCCP104417_0117, partial [Vibrio cholerae CP1044(17)]